MFIDANILQPLITAFEAVIKFFHGFVGSWGWSIILLTVAIRLVLLPLTVKQFHSMQKLQRLTPEIKRVQAKYKQDKQRQQQELMKLYQEHGVNPFSSCLPFVVQIPVLYALFFLLRSDLRADICPSINQHLANGHLVHNMTLKPCGAYHGAGFLFIPDLTNHATGVVLIVLIVLYVVTQLGSSLLMSSPTMDKRQRQMMLILPLVFVFIILGLPAGVIVYWITTNALLVVQQYGVKRILGPVTPVPATGSDAADAGGDGKAAAKTPVKKPEPPPKRSQRPGKAAADGNGAGGGLGGLLRGRQKANGEREAVGAGSARPSGPPPRPPRKKKKRSGRRR